MIDIAGFAYLPPPGCPGSYFNDLLEGRFDFFGFFFA
jgi:hypothetical protein